MNKRTASWFLILVLVLVATLAAWAGSTAPAGGDRESGDETAARGAIRAVAKEFSFALDKPEAPAGAVTFVVENNGSATHDFAIAGNGLAEATAKIAPSDSATLTAGLEPGTYTYRCTIPGHEALGMHGTLTPLVLFPGEAFMHFPYAPALEGQYIIKNLVLIGAGLVIGATVRGGRIVPEPQEVERRQFQLRPEPVRVRRP